MSAEERKENFDEAVRRARRACIAGANCGLNVAAKGMATTVWVIRALHEREGKYPMAIANYIFRGGQMPWKNS